MKRSITKSRLNDVEHLYRVVLESDECDATSMEGRRQQRELLRIVVDNPGMMECGVAFFQKLKMSHNGSAWIIEMEAVAT